MSDDFVQFPVPVNRVAEVAVFLYGASQAMPQATALPGAPEVPISVEQHHELLTRIYVESEPRFRRLLMLLADRAHPEDHMAFTEVSTAMDWDKPRRLPGALGAYGRRTKHRYGGCWPFHRGRDASTGEHYLAMDEDDAAFLRDLHAQRQLPTA